MIVMKNCMLILALISVVFTLNAQDKDWTNSVSKDGKTKVDYAIYDITDDAGEKLQILEYKAERVAKATVEQCVRLVKSAELHAQYLMDTEESELIETINDNEWTVYYLFNPPRPIPDSDSAAKFVQKNISENEVKITGTSAPGAYPKKLLVMVIMIAPILPAPFSAIASSNFIKSKLPLKG